MQSTHTFSAELSNLAAIRRLVHDAAAALQIEPDATLDMVQAVDEAATNIIVHGYRGLPGEIDVQVSREQDALVVRLRDHAAPFDPTQVPPPDLSLPLEMRRAGGLGVYLMRHFTDAMTHRVTLAGDNELVLLKKVHTVSREATHEH